MGLGAVRQDGEVGSVLWIKSGESTFWEQTLTCYHRKWHTSIKLTFALSKAFDMALFVLHWGNGLPRWFTSKESTYQCRRCRLHPWVGKIPGGGNGNPLQGPGLENPTDRAAWLATVHGVSKSQIWLSNRACTMNKCILNECLHHKMAYTIFFYQRITWKIFQFTIGLHG